MMHTITRKYRTMRKMMREIGLLRTLRITADKAALKLLRKVYGFHPVHTIIPLSSRPYRYIVAELANGLKPHCVVEVGCGLGIILSLIKAPNRCGSDIDEGAIKAARLLRRGVSFSHGDITTVSQQPIDVLILVNWIHEYSPEQLDIWLSPMLSRTSYLLMDAIYPDAPKYYRYRHDFKFLGTRVRHVATRPVPNETRKIVLYKVTL